MFSIFGSCSRVRLPLDEGAIQVGLRYDVHTQAEASSEFNLVDRRELERSGQALLEVEDSVEVFAPIVF